MTPRDRGRGRVCRCPRSAPVFSSPASPHARTRTRQGCRPSGMPFSLRLRVPLGDRWRASGTGPCTSPSPAGTHAGCRPLDGRGTRRARGHDRPRPRRGASPRCACRSSAAKAAPPKRARPRAATGRRHLPAWRRALRVRGARALATRDDAARANAPTARPQHADATCRAGRDPDDRRRLHDRHARDDGALPPCRRLARRRVPRARVAGRARLDALSAERVRRLLRDSRD